MAPSAIFLASKDSIFLVKLLNLPLHCLYARLFPISVVFGIVLVSLFQMAVFVTQIAIIVELLVDFIVKEMLLGHLREGFEMLISETGSIIEPIPLNYFLKAKLITHSKYLY